MNSKESSKDRIGGRGFDTEKTVNAKVLRWSKGEALKEEYQCACSTVSKGESGCRKAWGAGRGQRAGLKVTAENWDCIPRAVESHCKC